MPGIFNIGNSYNPNSKKITSKLTFDVGEKFSGKVIKGDNNEVTIKLTDGWEFSAIIEGDISDLQNVLQRFTVEGYENGKLKLKLIDKNSGDEEVSKDFTTVINKEGLKGIDKELLETMIKFDIPLTKENIKDIKGLIQFLEKIKANPKEIEEFITKYLETKGVDVNSEIGEKLGNTLKEFLTSFKGLTKADILLFMENGIEFNKENIDSYNNIFKESNSINNFLEELTKGNPLNKEINTIKDGLVNIKDIDESNLKSSNLSKNENTLTSSSKFAKGVYQKTDSNNSKVSMLSLLKSMTGKSEDIINVTLKEVLVTRKNNFTSNDFEKIFNNITNMDSSKIIEDLVVNINGFSEINNKNDLIGFNNYLENVSNEKLGVNENLNFSKEQLDKLLSQVMGKDISLNNDEFEKLKDAINLRYNDMLEEGTIKEELTSGSQKVNLNKEILKNNVGNENLKNTENKFDAKGLKGKEITLNEGLKGSNIENLKNGNALEDGINKNVSTKEIVQQVITKIGEGNKEIIKDALLALKTEGDISDKILTIIKNNINDIKIFNKFSGDYYYANLPVNINEREYPCKLIVKDNRKEGKKIDSKNVKMVITIDTKNLGVVDGYMKVNDKRIDIDLKCEEKSVKILDMAKERLMTNIESMGFLVNINVYKKLEEVLLTTCRDFFNTGTKISLDRRV
ncbi:hypothetical protein [Clostridium sp.]|uniref:hypothetical protein n=1 Tax=Clostridium sp. TaxID=1506 RepID=UPI0026309566|nr:hypothetical protein [Clostridium sp.]